MRRVLPLVLAVSSLALVAAKPPPKAPGAAPAEFQNAALTGTLQLLSQACTSDGDDAPVVTVSLYREGDNGLMSAQPTKVGACRWTDPNGFFEAGLFGIYAATSGIDWAKMPAGLNTWSLLGGRERAEVDEAFRRTFGEPLVVKSQWNGYQMRRAYNPKALEAAFARLYVKPTETRAGVSMQLLYDVAVKDRVRQLAKSIVVARGRKGWLEQKAQAFDAEATAKGNAFYYADFTYAAVDELPRGIDQPSLLDGRTLGFLLRRQIDGTLPVIAKILKAVIKDYDPALAKEVGDSL